MTSLKTFGAVPSVFGQAATAEDAGMVATAHSPTARGEADFSGFTVN